MSDATQLPSNSLVDRAWLLETDWGPYIHYFGPQGGVRSRGGGHIGTEPHEFTRDANRATLFRTKEDAEQFLQWMQANIRHSWLGWKVSEHEWVTPRTAHEPPAGCAQCSNVAPIAKLTVRDGLAVRAGLYAPGLPDGDHDVYPAASTPPPAPAPIETAPQDGTPILGWAAGYGWRETKSVTFQPGSPGHARGDTSRWWTWDEPVCNWAHGWKPTHWMPLPEGPTSTKGEG